MLEIHTLPVGPLEANCYLLVGREGCIAVDPGEEAGRIGAQVEKLGRRLAAVLLTHGHFDHIGAAKELRERYGCPIAIGEKDAELLGDPEKSLAGAGCAGCYLFEADRLLRDGESIEAAGLRLQALETPGHTLGSVSYLCEGRLFCGDVLFRGGVGRTDFYGGSFSVLGETLRALAALPEETLVYPGHGGSTDIGQEKKSNPFLRMMMSDEDFY
jgi:hydroxyacylglutathione hydrolase